jgi:hypothetical protein
MLPRPGTICGASLPAPVQTKVMLEIMIDHDSAGVLSTGRDSFGFTPYFFRLARPHGQPPKVTNISMAWKNLAIGLPFLALVQIGHFFSQ